MSTADGMANERLAKVVDGVAGALRRAVLDLRVTETELWQAIDFLTELGRRGEVALLSDVLEISVLVDQITYGGGDGSTASNVQGPYYLPGAPMLQPPYELAGPDEPGQPLAVTGRVTDSVTSAPLPGAVLDVWQTDAQGLYSNQVPGRSEFHLRGKVPVAEDGTYGFRTVTPPPYEIPKDGPVGRLLRALGRHAFRPAHLHLKVTAEGYRPLTTMVFFEGDEYLESDTIGAVKGPLVVKLEREGAEGSRAVCRFDIALRPL
jgi:protocatechuate 3,4-dioxygenase beta subunit